MKNNCYVIINLIAHFYGKLLKDEMGVTACNAEDEAFT